ncbi:uncharacterized protein LOC120357550 isoform X2 [Solenopsis invicta]|uniref:uncharacterized protein LOC120357550 isoform X2 n=1 Tax=Solenopsis invicta TaxID=13686 RepID=UPI00193DA5AF|nr:uncharacterized protein LOC120357550 isoform X2 [Solenopsis invicta]
MVEFQRRVTALAATENIPIVEARDKLKTNASFSSSKLSSRNEDSDSSLNMRSYAQALNQESALVRSSPHTRSMRLVDRCTQDLESPRQNQYKEYKDASALKPGHQLHLAHAEALTSPNGRTPNISKNSALHAYKDVQSNEEVDNVAKRVARLGNRIYFKIPHSDLHAEAAKACDIVSRAYLEDSFWVKGIIRGVIKKRLKREEIVTINRIRCDHYNLAYSLHRKNLTNLRIVTAVRAEKT